MTLAQFVARYKGRRIDVDGVYGAQCWDLAALYSQKVVGVPAKYSYGLPTGNGCAAGVFYNFPAPLSKYYKRIANNPNDPNQLPKAGDLIVWGYRLPGSGGCGHIAIAQAVHASNFVSLDQNWGGAYAHNVRHNWNYVVGWLRKR